MKKLIIILKEYKEKRRKRDEKFKK